MARPAEVPAKSGFTLIELLVAIVITGILVGIVFEMILGQGRFARFQSAREEVQQNSRAALEIITSEIRPAAAQGIVAGDAGSITIHSPRAWGYICSYVGGGTEFLAVLFPEAALPEFQNVASGASVDFAFPVGTTSSATYVTVSDVTATHATSAASECQTALQPNPTVAASPNRARMFQHPSASFPAGLTAGSAVYLYQPVTYNVMTSPDVQGYWIHRNGEPFAGPVPETGGLVFTYYEFDVATDAFTDITADVTSDPTRLADVSRIGVQVVTHSNATFGGVPQDNTASTEVYLRNGN